MTSDAIVYAIREDRGLWCVCRDQTPLVDRLGLADAIRHACAVAREHHQRSGETIIVQVVTAECSSVLVQYARPPQQQQETVAA